MVIALSYAKSFEASVNGAEIPVTDGFADEIGSLHEMVISMQLDEDMVRSACEQLGARHVDFIARGFNSNFWDIFLVCMAEAIDATLSSYITDEAKRAEMILAWQRVFNMIVHHMRTGYNERRKEKLKQSGKMELDY
ncbi:hypothetical protein ANCDUO_10017 [Ancylostoma duodenale]|uniref:Globin domain-containing protein n=1 Tax=Ancylostoma duodenale TaxID=51022 RepID=A0A0C2CSC1_9BILA|nr:hypothetical protein ANCDUO_10017 [Ancylostoma duodenale]